MKKLKRTVITSEKHKEKVNEYYLCPSCWSVCNIKGKIKSTIHKKETAPGFMLTTHARNNLYIMSCDKCGQTMFRCDKSMIPPIRKLNQHKLYTWVCCSGHYSTTRLDKYLKVSIDEAYIGFRGDYKAIEDTFKNNDFKYWDLEKDNLHGNNNANCFILRVRSNLYNAISEIADTEIARAAFKDLKKSYMKEFDMIVDLAISSVLDIGTESITSINYSDLNIKYGECLGSSDGVGYYYKYGHISMVNLSTGELITGVNAVELLAGYFNSLEDLDFVN